MKWFKHSTDSHDDPDVSDAMDEFGDAGYSVFFIILEIYGREFNQLSDGWLSVSQAFVRRKLRKSWTKAEQILNFYQTKNRIYYETDGKQVRIKVPKFSKKASNWVKREQNKKQALPTEAPTEAPTAREVEVEVEVEEEDIEDTSVSSSAVLAIPLVDKSEFSITQKDVDEWQESFPGIDVLLTLKKIRQWNIDHPQNRKTRRGIRAHVSGWLGRDQDRARTDGKASVPGKRTSALQGSFENLGKVGSNAD